ncbi:VacJ family lipoprotein [Belnapia sp. T18]|uniref:VacJ family lipoprotein n=1 Tax=Belnapia arida TaxID=2804533 RepID=A0ABS1UAH4_9PROT|nr:VacJ family lipoprotein [Belnapia arida]MBL6081680.1 VacJ family lipoprotein [Belnapia arida]
MFITSRVFLAASLLLPLTVMAGCASRSGEMVGPTSEVSDPAEPVNRVVFAGNHFLDRNIVAPIARGYRDHVPVPVRNSVRNFSSNLVEPRVLVNDLLQGNVTRGWNTTQRFVVNSTLGAAGLFDVATKWGLPGHQADFGQTFGVWGVGPGPAVQLPLLGPTNLRDTVGTVAGFVANPLSVVGSDIIETVALVGTGAGVIDSRAGALEATDGLEASSLDYYAALRSAQAQRRAALVAEAIRGEVIVPPRGLGRTSGATVPNAPVQP